MYKKNKLIPNTLGGMFCIAILVLIQGCAVGEALLFANSEGYSVTRNRALAGQNSRNAQPACQLECVTTDKGLTEVISATGLSTYWVEACFASTWESELTDVQYCEKSLNQFCERAVVKLEKENPLYSQCKVLETSECVQPGDERFPECKGTVWSPPGKRPD